MGYRESWSTRDGQGGYADAVGDIGVVDEKWGPSVGWFQVRSLRNPMGFSVRDQVRYARALLNPYFAAEAAFVISEGGTNWNAWSVYRSGSYLQNKGMDYELRSGHERAAEWSK